MIKHRIVYNPAIDWQIDISKAEDSFLWDIDGKKYIDFSSGWNVTNLGWNNPEVNQTVIEQASKNVYVPMWMADEAQIAYAKAITDAFPAELNTVCRATGGTEANEMALKIARAATGRKKIISFAHTYHGQSFGTLALGFVPAYVEKISPLVPEFIQLDYPEASNGTEIDEEVLAMFKETIETLLKAEDVAAVFTEAGMITGWGSMKVAPTGYLTLLRELTAKYGTLLVVDEVGTGFSRTGKMFAIERENVVPDIVTLSKAIANGAATIGAVITKSTLVESIIGNFKPTSSLGWTPLACAVALKTLEIHQRDEVWLEAERKGQLVKSLLNEKLSGHVLFHNLRGKGLEIAFNLYDARTSRDENDETSTTIVQKAMESGLHLANAGDCIQLMPPLTITDKVLEEGVDILIRVLNNSKS